MATIVPFDASQPADRTPTRVPVAHGLLVAWQLTKDRTAELLAGTEDDFARAAGGKEGDGGGVMS
ncbi:MAG: hypothetical protein ACK6AO_11100 [Planctomycetota bacterium]